MTSFLLFSHWVVSNSLWPHGLQHTRLPCPSPSPRVFSDSQVHCVGDAIQPSHPLSPPSPPPLLSPFFISGGQRIGVSALVLPMNIQSWFPLGLTGLISLQFKGLSRVFSGTKVQSIKSLALSLLYGPTLTSIHDYQENHSFERMPKAAPSTIRTPGRDPLMERLPKERHIKQWLWPSACPVFIQRCQDDDSDE